MGETRRFQTFPPHPERKGQHSRDILWWRRKIIELWVKRSSAPTAGSRQLAEQLPRIFEIGGGEALGEPAVEGGEQVAGCGAAALVAP